MKTKTLLHLLLLSLAALTLSGCFPEERVWWSPQGDRALVLVEGRIHLVGADGTLGAPLTDKLSTEDVMVQTVSWLRDGSGFVCQRIRLIPRWEEAVSLISADEVKAVDLLLPAVIPLLDAAVKLAGEAKSLDDILKALPVAHPKAFAMALRRTFQQDPAKVEALLHALPHGADIVAALQKDGAAFPLNELCVFKLDATGALAQPPASLVRSLLSPLLLPCVSPQQDMLAFLRLDQDEESAALELITLDGRASTSVARNVSAAFDWMPDGRSLVFMAPIGGDGEKLQSIHRVTVVEKDGTLLNQSTRQDPMTLATAATLNRPALQALADGRVLFASHTVALPVLGTGTELEPRLFIISADGQSIQPVPTAPGDLPTNLAWFTAAPDGRHVAVVEGETDAVAVVELATGKTQLISPPHPRWQCRTIPAWKSAIELTFAGLHENTPAWMLWSEAQGLRHLSAKWPAAITAKWLEQRSDNSTGTDAPVSKPATDPR